MYRGYDDLYDLQLRDGGGHDPRGVWSKTDSPGSREWLENSIDQRLSLDVRVYDIMYAFLSSRS